MADSEQPSVGAGEVSPHIPQPVIHALITAASGRLFKDGYYDEAVFKSYKAIEDRVKRLSGKPEIGKRLMTYVFNESAPTLDVVSANADEGQAADEREGFKFLFMGSAQAFRNPRGHGGDLGTPEAEAAEMLVLASLLMRALDRAEKQQLLERPDADALGEWDDDDGSNDDDNEPGALDQIAAAEDALPNLKATIDQMAACLAKIGEIATHYTPKITSAAQSPNTATRLVVVNELADALGSPTQRFRELAADYVGQMVDLDAGIDALIHMTPFASMPVDDQAEYLVLAESVSDFRTASIEGVEAAANLSEQFRGVAKLSRSLKKPAADLRDGVRQMQSVQHYYDEWVDGFREASSD